MTDENTSDQPLSQDDMQEPAESEADRKFEQISDRLDVLEALEKHEREIGRQQAQREIDDKQDRAIDAMTEKMQQLEDALEDGGLFSSGIAGEKVVDGKRVTARYKWAHAEKWQKRRLFNSTIVVIGLAAAFLLLTCSNL